MTTLESTRRFLACRMGVDPRRITPESTLALDGAAKIDLLGREVTAFGDGGRQPGQFYGVHSIATDSKGNVYTTETWEGKRLQKFVYKGIGNVMAANQGVLWPKR